MDTESVTSPPAPAVTWCEVMYTSLSLITRKSSWEPPAIDMEMVASLKCLPEMQFFEMFGDARSYFLVKCRSCAWPLPTAMPPPLMLAALLAPQLQL